jgi:hypothetical protein
VNYDGRGLNAKLIECDNHQLPTIQSIHERYAGHKYFTVLDLLQSFTQWKINEADRHKTAFTYNNIQYMFIGAPFGTKPLSHVVQRTMSYIIGPLPFAVSFIDDITIFSTTFEEHIQHVKEVLRLLTKWNLKLRLEKCHFCYPSVKNLGYIISATGILPDPMKVKEAGKWPIPVTGKQIQSFLGLMNFFRESIPGFSHMSGPLDQLRGEKDLKQVWNEKHTECFNLLKSMLSSAPVLSYPDLNEKMILATDASNYGIGAVLYQEYNNKKHYLRFLSSTLKGGQKNYSATKRNY